MTDHDIDNDQAAITLPYTMVRLEEGSRTNPVRSAQIHVT